MQQIYTDSMRDSRLRLGMTLRDLAVQCAREGASVDNSQLSKIERGLHRPRPRLRSVLARILDLDAAAYFEAQRPRAPQ